MQLRVRRVLIAAAALSALAILPGLPGAGSSQATAAAGPVVPFPGCGQAASRTTWAGSLTIIWNSSCTILVNRTRGWKQAPLGSSGPGTISTTSGLSFTGTNITAQSGLGLWIPGNGADRQRRNCTSTCLGSSRRTQAPTTGTAYSFRPEQWGVSGCTSRAASALHCRTTAYYKLTSTGSKVQKRASGLVGANARMSVRSSATNLPTVSCNGLRYVECTNPRTGRAAGSVENRVDRIYLDTRLITVRIHNQINQRLNLTDQNFGNWVRDARAEFRADTRRDNGLYNNSYSIAPFWGIEGVAQWGALLPIGVASTASFGYTFVNTDLNGRTNTAFTGSAIRLTVNLDASGNNLSSDPSFCTSTVSGQAGRPVCRGTAADASVAVRPADNDRVIDIFIEAN